MKITNERLKMRIYGLLGKEENEKITEYELEKITSFSICQKNEKLEDVYFTDNDFECLKFVKSLTLSMFIIDDKIIERINNMKNLKSITFSECIFNTSEKIKSNLSTVIIVNPIALDINIFYSVLNVTCLEFVDAVDLDVSDLTRFENIEWLYLYNCKLRNFESVKNFKNLKKIYLDGSNVTIESLDELIKRDILVEYSDKYLPVV